MKDDGRKILVHFIEHVCVEFLDKVGIIIAREVEERNPTQHYKNIFKPKICSMTSSPKDFSMIILREALSVSHFQAVSERRSGKGRTLGVRSGEVPSTLALFDLDFEEEATAFLEAIGRVERKGKIGKTKGRTQH
ncbi:hypothetical protein M9H77_11689 [Catharanthus roseus]|uniref:Uncharacterized protein n=1 Tax=Catharanthus roseus TaxID=4058 RepID=A0ACC0BFC5_CATRO|nr:hypothetical protein M9H77_11689 [Catharanthus roseus]